MKKGFTLAEVLITLGVLGIVAALTLPELVKNVQDNAFAKSKENSLAKITEATKEMKSNGVLDGYKNNNAFADEFQKYMKITKRCDSSTLSSCFVPTIKASNGQSVDVTTLTTGTKLGSNNISGNTIGLMLTNGTTMLFTLRDDTKVGSSCDYIDPANNTSDTTGCLSFLYDINGYGGPNTLGKDIGNVNVNIAGLTCSGTKVGSLCVDSEDLIPDLTYSYLDTYAGSVDDKAYDPACSSSDNICKTNYWAGAKKACADKNMRLPTKAELNTLYLNKSTIGGFTESDTFLITGNYWSSTEFNSILGWYQGFRDGVQNGGSKNNKRFARCVK